MIITTSQYAKIEDCFPMHRGNVRLSNLAILNAFLFVVENGCKWRALPQEYGCWHTVYTRISRWAKNGTLDKVFAKLQQQQILSIKIDVVSMDSTSVKVHPDAAGALKKTDRNPSDNHVEGAIPKYIWLPRVIG